MKLFLTGAAGLLGTAVHRSAEIRGHRVTAPAREELDVTDPEAVRRSIEKAAPDAVVHCAGHVDVDGAETPDGRRRAMIVNAGGTAVVAAAAAASRSLLVYPSTDYVFEGGGEEPYRPHDLAHPINAYGESKRAGEQAVQEAEGTWLIVRTSWLYGGGGPNFVDGILERVRGAGKDGSAPPTLRIVDDQRGRPTWTGSLAPALVELTERAVAEAIGSAGAGGAPSDGRVDARRAGADGHATAERRPMSVRSGGRTLHLADRGEASWLELAREALRMAGLEAELVPVSSEEWGAPAPRPRYSVLDLDEAEELLGRRMPEWTESLRRYLRGTEERT